MVYGDLGLLAAMTGWARASPQQGTCVSLSFGEFVVLFLHMTELSLAQVPGCWGSSMPSSSLISGSSRVRLARASCCCGFRTPGAGAAGRDSGERGECQEGWSVGGG
jgi:hypothetical protein